MPVKTLLKSLSIFIVSNLLLCAKSKIFWNVYVIIGIAYIAGAGFVCSVLWGTRCLLSVSPIFCTLAVGLAVHTLSSVIPAA